MRFSLRKFFKSVLESKNRYAAVILTLVVAGLGHFYLRRWTRGLVWIVTGIVIGSVLTLFGYNLGAIVKAGLILQIVCALDAWIIATGRKGGLMSRKQLLRFLKFKKSKMLLPIVLVLMFISFIFGFASSSVFTKYSNEIVVNVFNNYKAEEYRDMYMLFNNIKKAEEMDGVAERLALEGAVISKKMKSEYGPLEYVVSFGGAVMGPLGLDLNQKEFIGNYITSPYQNKGFTTALTDMMCGRTGYSVEIQKINNMEQLNSFVKEHPPDKRESCEDYQEGLKPEWEGRTIELVSGVVDTSMLIASSMAGFYIIFFFVEGYLISCVLVFGWEYWKKRKRNF